MRQATHLLFCVVRCPEFSGKRCESATFRHLILTLVRIHIFTRTSYQLVIPVTPVVVKAHTTTKLHELKTPLERAGVDGGASNGPPQTPSGSKSVALWGRSRDKAQCTHTPTGTMEVRTGKLYKSTLWANVLGIFAQAPAHRRPSRDALASFARSGVWLLITTRV